ncbi:unnamed protein product [Urochloa humidicola]
MACVVPLPLAHGGAPSGKGKSTRADPEMEELGDSSEEGCRFGSELDNFVPSRQERRALGSYFEAEANSIKTGETPQLAHEDLSKECWSQQIHNMEKLLKKEEVILTTWTANNLVLCCLSGSLRMVSFVLDVLIMCLCACDETLASPTT